MNLQLRSPQHVSNGIGDHYIVVDFNGWRYFELIEPEGQRHAEYQWPYGDIYSIYRESVNFGRIQSLGLWCNHLPPGKPAVCYLSPIKAMPLVAGRLIHPTVSVGRETVTLPVEIPSGHYLELNGAGECKLYGMKGELVRDVQLSGRVPLVQPGENEVGFRTQTLPGLLPRAQVTVITHGNAIRD